MKKIITLLLACALYTALAVPAFAVYNYGFESGADTLPGFGKSTSTDEPVSTDPMSQNERRNKDNSAMPPPYFVGSGDIPTEPSSLYHDNTPSGAGNGYNGNGSGGDYSGTGGASFTPPAPGFEVSTSVAPAYSAPRYYADGSIGTIYVARTKQTIKVYEGEQLNNLRIGAGHFKSTSTWDGNVALCGHNRGGAGYFSFVKDLQIGDKVTYTTLYGTRTYEVYSKEQINEYDHSKLNFTMDNVLTLLTCVAGIPELRYAAQLKEVR